MCLSALVTAHIGLWQAAAKQAAAKAQTAAKGAADKTSAAMKEQDAKLGLSAKADEAANKVRLYLHQVIAHRHWHLIDATREAYIERAGWC